MAPKARLGAVVKQPPPNVRPDGRVLFGATVTLEKLDLARHGDGLWQAFSADKAGAVWTYLPYGPFEGQAEFERCYKVLSDSGDPLFYAIIPRATRVPAGVASYLNIVPQHGSIEIGHINLSPALQHTREATEALFLMMRHAVDDLGNRRLEWKCNALNAASRSAAERLGFTFEGIFRQHLVVKGRNRDSAWYSIVDGEWPHLREAFLTWLNDDNFTAKGAQKKALSELTQAALSEAHA